MSDDKATFLVMATFMPSNYTRPFFVRANSLADAYVQVVTENQEAFQTPRFTLEVHVVSLDMLPDVKAVAQAYWDAGREAEANPNHDWTFEDYWAEHGARKPQ